MDRDSASEKFPDSNIETIVQPNATLGLQNAPKIKNGWGSAPDPTGELTAFPQTP